MRTTPLFIAMSALKEIQYTHTGAGHSYDDLCRVKQITERALKRLGGWEMSLEEFQIRAKKARM
jgi:hypothetical protein